MARTKTTQRKLNKLSKIVERNCSDVENEMFLYKHLPNLNHKRRLELIEKFNDDTELLLKEYVVKPLVLNNSSPDFLIKELTNEGNSLYCAVCYLLFGNTEFHSHLRNAIMNFMRNNATILNESKHVSGGSWYKTVEHYMNETQCDQLGRIPNKGIIELAAIAMYFDIPVYLFSSPVKSPPFIFEPADERRHQQCALVLYKEFDVFSPVLEFESTSFQHAMRNRNENSVQLVNYDETDFIDVNISRLNMLSAKLCEDVVRQAGPYKCYLYEDSFNNFKDAIIEHSSDMEPDIHLLNFACYWNCFYLIEQQLMLFTSCNEISLLIPFINGLRDESEKYRELLLNYFIDVCNQSSADKLYRVATNATDKRIRSIMKDIAKTKSKYILSTKDVTVALSDGTLAFKDEIPFTLLAIKKNLGGLADSLLYYTGPKAKNEKWLNFILNKRIPKLKNTNLILFFKSSLYIYYKETNTLGYMKNVFQYKEPFKYLDVPKPKKKILRSTVRLVTSDQNLNYILDIPSKQVYSIQDEEWRELYEVETICKTEDCEVCQIVTSAGSRETVIIPEQRSANNTNLFAFRSILNQPVIFQYTLSEDVDKFTVEKRLAGQYIYLDTGAKEREKSIGSYTFVHYKIPLCRKSKCIYTLMETEPLNGMIREHQSSPDINTIKDVISMKDHSKLFHSICEFIGYPKELTQKYSDLLKTDANKCMNQLLEEWYEHAKYVCTYITKPKINTNYYSVKPEDLWGIAYREMGEIDLYNQLILSSKQKNMLRGYNYAGLHEEVISKIHDYILQQKIVR